MTEKELLMYDIISRISSIDSPIIFKGALVTKLILSENNYCDIQRMTKDIDANWVGKPPLMSTITKTISNALGELNDRFIVSANREYGENKSAGISLYDKDTGDKVVSFDVDIKPSVGDRLYYYGQASIRGVMANEIILDKICTISSDAVYKHRTKDIVDIYALLHCVSFRFDEITTLCNKTKRNIKSFDAFQNKKSEIEYAYNKLKGINGKPDFSVVYNYLERFFKPFINPIATKIIWLPKYDSWEFLSQETDKQKQSNTQQFKSNNLTESEEDDFDLEP